MSVSVILTSALALVATLLAVAMAFSPATNTEMAGFYLLAAATSSFAIHVYG